MSVACIKTGVHTPSQAYEALASTRTRILACLRGCLSPVCGLTLPPPYVPALSSVCPQRYVHTNSPLCPLCAHNGIFTPIVHCVPCVSPTVYSHQYSSLSPCGPPTVSSRPVGQFLQPTVSRCKVTMCASVDECVVPPQFILKTPG